MSSSMKLSNEKDLLLLIYALLSFKYIIKAKKSTIWVYTASGLFIDI